MDGWKWPALAKEDVAKNASVVISNYLMACTRHIEHWNEKAYRRAFQWTWWIQSVSTTLSTPLTDSAKEELRTSSSAALLRWSRNVYELNVTWRQEPTFEFFRRNQYFLLHAIINNTNVPREVMRFALMDLPSLSGPTEKGSEQLQRLIGEQTSQHGAVDLLLSMNQDLDDLLESIDDDLSHCGTNTAESNDPGTQTEDLLDFRNSASLGLIRSKSFSSLLKNDFKNGDISTNSAQKVLEIVKEWILKDHFCLQQICLLLQSMGSRPLSIWLNDIQSRDSVFAVRLWRMQDHVLLAEIASKFATFFKSYLHFLVSALRTARTKIHTEYQLSPTWYSSFSLAISVADNYKLRIKSLINIPRLSVPTKTYLSDQGLSID